VTFLILISPFDIAELTFKWKLIILPVYGAIAFLCYMVLVPIQNLAFRKIKTWTLLMEIAFVLLFDVLVFFISYAYYQSSLVKGNYSFSSFALQIFLPVVGILMPILIGARWIRLRKSSVHQNQSIILKGDNKLDFLKLAIEDLIGVSGATNYVEVHFLKEGIKKSKLLRTTLKTIEKEVPSLVKVHRSHLINPMHFSEWKNADTINLGKVEVPVSMKYKKHLLTVLDSSLKSSPSSQME